ncbi:MAG: cytidylate kinase-like family protein [Firmicutes bacterium]|nr:cytidylate kinase-like family protein [Blautia sp.]MDD7370098.1 cytidylate kinase-like family protein [Bacillota bacterium]MDY3716007.1 cytidylate kinase-like family protein [Blautia sp.]
MKKIITISREFGSGGRFIGEALAKELNFAFYDKNIIEQVAQETGLSEKYIAERGEYALSHNRFSYGFIGRTMQGNSVDDLIYQAQTNIICDLAEKGNCVIVGRCADYILRNRSDVLNVFIHGNKAEKAQRIMNLYGKTEQEALVLMKDTDKKRAVNYAYCTDQKWGVSKNYALCMNSSILGYETCIEIIKGCL